MFDKRKHALPTPEKPKTDVAQVIWGGVTGAYETQAISDVSARQPQTGVAIPDNFCVDESKDWVDFNEK